MASLIFGHSDNLSKTLQHTYISAVEGQSVAKMSVKTLKVMSDTQFDLFWSKVLREASRLDVDDPTLRRKRKRPTRFELSNATPSFPESPKDYFRLIYLAPWILLLLALNRDLINQDMKYIAKWSLF